VDLITELGLAVDHLTHTVILMMNGILFNFNSHLLNFEIPLNLPPLFARSDGYTNDGESFLLQSATAVHCPLTPRMLEIYNFQSMKWFVDSSIELKDIEMAAKERSNEM
jgi:hypothetical protein